MTKPPHPSPPALVTLSASTRTTVTEPPGPPRARARPTGRARVVVSSSRSHGRVGGTRPRTCTRRPGGRVLQFVAALRVDLPLRRRRVALATRDSTTTPYGSNRKSTRVRRAVAAMNHLSPRPRQTARSASGRGSHARASCDRPHRPATRRAVGNPNGRAPGGNGVRYEARPVRRARANGRIDRSDQPATRDPGPGQIDDRLELPTSHEGAEVTTSRRERGPSNAPTDRRGVAVTPWDSQ